MVLEGYIDKNFSKSAKTYDKYAKVQSYAATKLLELLDRDDFSNILDIGCGTGLYTKLLQEEFSLSQIMAIDISNRMIEEARYRVDSERVKFLAVDAESFCTDDKFDLITSNATFQWFKDFDASILRYKDMLSDDGVMLFSIFGPKTFCELDMLGKSFIDPDRSTESKSFKGRSEIEKVLQAAFKAFDLKELIYDIEYPSMYDMLKSIKHTGTRGKGLLSNGLLTKSKIDLMQDAYIKRFSTISATYQIFFCKCKR